MAVYPEVFKVRFVRLTEVNPAVNAVYGSPARYVRQTGTLGKRHKRFICLPEPCSSVTSVKYKSFVNQHRPRHAVDEIPEHMPSSTKSTRNTESSRRTVGEKSSVPESPASILAQTLGLSRAEVKGCEWLRVQAGGKWGFAGF